MNKASERESVPLGWVEKWVEKPLAEALKATDAVPMREDTHAQWLAVRERIRQALAACRELRRLAAWLDSFPHVVVEPLHHERTEDHPRRLAPRRNHRRYK